MAATITLLLSCCWVAVGLRAIPGASAVGAARLCAIGLLAGAVAIASTAGLSLLADRLFPGASGLAWDLSCVAGAALSEEALKCGLALLAARLLAKTPGQALACALACSLGFAALENLVYLHAAGSATVLATRSLISMPAHLAFAGIWGLAMARIPVLGRTLSVPAACAAAGVAHLLHNAMLLDGITPSATIGLCLTAPLVVVVGLRVLRDGVRKIAS